MRNKLSPDNAPYPNKNDVFTYVLSSDLEIHTLKCRFSAGDYRLRNMTVKTVKLPSIENENITEARMSPEYTFDGRTVFRGSVNMKREGYFVTSWPYKDGYEINVDGKKEAAKKINRAFLGVPLEQGRHTINIKYTAPGFPAGVVISGVSFGIALAGLLRRRWRKE